jgi:hypothetical protein
MREGPIKLFPVTSENPDDLAFFGSWRIFSENVYLDSMGEKL